MSDAHEHPNYLKVWYWLLILLVISTVGPMLEIQAVTLVTAFGIAIVKSYMVAANFMHLKFEKRIIWLLLLMSVCLLGVFFFGVAPDVMMGEGDQWVDCIAEKWAKTSSPPSSGVMNPKPLASLNHLTVPVAIMYSFGLF